MNLSHEYIGALAILLVSGLKALGVNVGNDEVVNIITGLVALYVAIRRYKRGDINMGGVKQ